MQNADRIIFGSIGVIVIAGWIIFAGATDRYDIPNTETNASLAVATAHESGVEDVIFEELETIEEEAKISSVLPHEEHDLPLEELPETEHLQTSPTLYINSLGEGWSHVVWEGTDISFEDVINVKSSAPWGRLILQAQGSFSTQDFNSLLFTLGNGSETSTDLYIALNDEAYNPLQYVNLSAYMDIQEFLSGAPVAIAIPLSTLNPENKKISELVIESSEPHTFALDTITFSVLDQSTYREPIIIETQEKTDITSTDEPVIFSDVFHNNWHISDHSWDAEGTFSSAVSFGGNTSIRIDFKDIWGTLRFDHLGGLDTTGKSYISFGAHGGTNGNQLLDIIVYDIHGNELGRRSIAEGDRLLARAWKNIRVPLYRLNSENTLIGGITFQVNESTSFVYIDDNLLTN